MAAERSGSSRSAASQALPPSALLERARAKVNLSLEVLGRRDDGYHELASLVVFAGVGDVLAICPDETLALEAVGPRARSCGEDADNLVLKAARSLLARRPALRLGRFVLDKRLPVAAGLGGGSADAAAALRLLARLNHLSPDDPDLRAAAIATGADVPVCLFAMPAMVRGVGETLRTLSLPRIAAVLVNPGVPVPTGAVFAALGLRPENGLKPAPDMTALSAGLDSGGLIDWLAARPNDLATAALKLQPVITDVITALRAREGCTLARMSGSGATCFALFETPRQALAAARAIKGANAGWWVRATAFGER